MTPCLDISEKDIKSLIYIILIQISKYSLLLWPLLTQKILNNIYVDFKFFETLYSTFKYMTYQQKQNFLSYLQLMIQQISAPQYQWHFN